MKKNQSSIFYFLFIACTLSASQSFAQGVSIAPATSESYKPTLERLQAVIDEKSTDQTVLNLDPLKIKTFECAYVLVEKESKMAVKIVGEADSHSILTVFNSEDQCVDAMFYYAGILVQARDNGKLIRVTQEGLADITFKSRDVQAKSAEELPYLRLL